MSRAIRQLDAHDPAVFGRPRPDDEALALHPIDDPRHRAVLGTDALGQVRKREISQPFEHLEDGELRARQVSPASELLRYPTAFRRKVDDGFENRVDLWLDVGRNRQGHLGVWRRCFVC